MDNPFLKKIENSFHGTVHSIESVFTSSESEALKVATAAAHFVESNGGKVLRDAASAGVVSAETVPGDGTVKLAAAFASVVAVLTTEGIPVVKSAVNLAIEMTLADAKQAGLINDPTPTPVAASAPAA